MSLVLQHIQIVERASWIRGLTEEQALEKAKKEALATCEYCLACIDPNMIASRQEESQDVQMVQTTEDHTVYE